MADSKLTFDILAKVKGEKDVKQLGSAIDELSDHLGKLNKAQVAGAFTALSSAAAPVVGLMTALPGVVGVGAAAFATMKMATSGLGDAFTALAEGDAEKISEALGKLAPAAREFALEGDSVRRQWGQVQQVVQQDMFAPLVGSMQKLTTAYLPAMKADLPDIASAFGEAGAQLTKWAAQADTVDRVRTIVQGTVPVVENLGVSVENIADLFARLGAAGVPVVQQLAQSVANLTGGMRNWAVEAEKSGKLDAIFAETSDTVAILEDTLASAGRAIGNLFANPSTVAFANSLFSTMNVGVKAVEALTSAFAALPGGIQQSILLLGVAAAATSKFNAATSTLGGALVARGESLQRFGAAGEKAGTKLAGFGRGLAGAAGALGPWAGIIAVGATALISFATASDRAQIATRNIQQLAQALLVFANTGKITGELGKTVGASFAEIQRKSDVAKLSIAAFEKQGGQFASTMQNSLGNSLKQVQSDFSATDQALKAMVNNGGATQARIAFDQIAVSLRKAGMSTADINKTFAQYQTAAAAAAASNTGVARGFGTIEANARTMTQSLQAAINAGQTLTSVFTQLNGGAISSVQALVQADNAAKAFSQSLAANGNALTTATVAGRANIAALTQLTTAAAQAAQAKYEETGSIQAANGVYNTYIAQLRATLTQAGLTKAQVDQLIATYASMPALKQTKISAPGAVQSSAEVKALRAQIAVLQGKVVKVQQSGAPDSAAKVAALRAQIARLQNRVVTITTVHITRNTVVTTATGSGEQAKRGNRWGGIHKPTAAANGLMATVARPGTLYQWAEPATGGEAFIPRKGNLNRSRKIATQVVEDWLGGQVSFPGGDSRGSAGGMGAGGASGAQRGSGGVTAAQVRELTRAIERLAAKPLVAVSSDGRRASLLARAG